MWSTEGALLAVEPTLPSNREDMQPSAIVSVTALLLLSACAGRRTDASAPPMVCTGAVSVTAHMSGLKVGTERIVVSVFPQPASIETPPTPPMIRLRFFHQGADPNRPGQELRRYLPESQPQLETSGIAPIQTPMGVVKRPMNFAVHVPFDAPGLWGVEVFLKVPWQQAPAMTTMMFHVAPSASAAPADPPVSSLTSRRGGFMGIALPI